MSAAGIEVSPARLDLKVDSEATTAQITVANPTADVQVFEIYADDFSEMFEFNPASFTLESGARKSVQITIFPSRRWGGNEGGVLATTISVLATPLASSRVTAATGVKIPITIATENGRGEKTSPVILIGAGAILFAAILWKLFHRRQRSPAA